MNKTELINAIAAEAGLTKAAAAKALAATTNAIAGALKAGDRARSRTGSGFHGGRLFKGFG